MLSLGGLVFGTAGQASTVEAMDTGMNVTVIDSTVGAGATVWGGGAADLITGGTGDDTLRGGGGQRHPGRRHSRGHRHLHRELGLQP